MSIRRTTEVGDTVIIRDRFTQVFKRAYGEDALEPRKVTAIEKVQGKKRLHLDGAPTLLWYGQAKVVKRGGED
jgi:hypothetical protein